MKKFKLVSIVLAIVLIIGILAIPASAAAWNWRIQKMNDIWYDVETVLGRGTNDAITAAVRDGYYAENGTNCTGSYYYSARENKTYYFGGGVINGKPDGNGNNGSGSGTGNNNTNYWDGTYLWFWDASSGYYYRYDQYGNLIWGTRTGGNGTTGGGTNGSNLPGYDYSYSGKKLYAGLITDTGYVDNSQATLLARMLGSSVSAEASMTKQAAVAWSVLYCVGGPSNLTDQKLRSSYSWYNSNASTTDSAGRDLVALARDVIFRYNAWKNGNTYVGQVLPSNYSWLCTYNNGITTCRSSQNGNDYTFPEAWSATKSQYHTPYTT